MSTPTTHSPGPWKTEIWKYSGEKPHRDLIVQNNQFWLAKIAWDEGLDNPYTIREQEARANAALIAAAPEMLEALQNLENDDNSIPAHAWAMVQSAIAKATTLPIV